MNDKLTTYPMGEEISYTDKVSPDSIHIEDIVHALSNIGRFNGHTSEFFSVAKHSLIMSYIIMQDCRLEALLHDACEAYCGDIVTPLKEELMRYDLIESRFDEAVRRKFRLPEQMSGAVKTIDYQAYLCEAKFYTNIETKRSPMVEIYEMWQRVNTMLIGRSNSEIAHMFVSRYEELSGR